jgi:hypothetical protein
MTGNYDPVAVLERYLALRDAEQNCDLLLVFGTFDERVAEHGAALLLRERAPLAIVSGARGRYTSAAPRAEALNFIELMVEAGVDRSRLIAETTATNTLENILRSWTLAQRNGIPRGTWGLVCRELQSRRTALTFALQCPAERGLAFPAPGTLHHDIYGDARAYQQRLVEEIERIERYGRSGDLVEQDIPNDVLEAAAELRGAFS